MDLLESVQQKAPTYSGARADDVQREAKKTDVVQSREEKFHGECYCHL